jgi:ABC-2 type transport system ATP-binding protein
MIEVESLAKWYGDSPAIEDVSFSVGKGEVVGFLGPNGAGKSTTMRIIAGSLGASSGRARVGGIDVAEDARGVQRQLGYAPEVPPLYGNMTVRDYVEFAAMLKGVADPAGAATKALARVDLAGVQARLIEHLSKGFKQRVGLAQALVHDPAVLVLDEPTSGLDPAQRVEIRQLITELAKGERTVILSTHVLAEVEAICSRVVVIHKGRVRAQDTIAGLGQEGRTCRVEVARRGPDARAALEKVTGVSAVGEDGNVYVVRGAPGSAEAVAAAAVPFGLLEFSSRERLEDIFLRLTGEGVA